MRALIVAWGYPPSRASGVHRAVAFARHLTGAGYEVVGLTADREFFELATGVDEELEASMPPTGRAERVAFPNIEDPFVNRWPALRASNRKRWAAEQESAIRRVFPEKYYGGWRDRLVARALALHAREPIDLVIATGNPYVGFAVAQALHTYHGVPYLMDDRDSFLYSVYTGELQVTAERIRGWWLALAERALAVWFVNPPIADLYRRDFPWLSDRIRVVENGWDGQYLHPDELPTVPEPVFGYVGTLNAMFPLEPLVEGWRTSRGTTIPGESELVIFGGLGYRQQPIAQRDLLLNAASFGLRTAGSLPKPRIAEAYRHCAVLVFSREGGALVTSSKIYEYMATGLPIAAVIPVDHDSRRVLSGYPRAHIRPPENPDAWSEALASAWQDARTTTPDLLRRARTWGRRFRRDLELAEPLDEVLTRVSVDRRSGEPNLPATER